MYSSGNIDVWNWIHLFGSHSILFLSAIMEVHKIFCFTIKIKNIVLTFGFMFGMFRGPDEHLRVFECPVAMWTVISENRLSSQHQSGYVFLATNKSTIWNYRVRPKNIYTHFNERKLYVVQSIIVNLNIFPSTQQHDICT